MTSTVTVDGLRNVYLKTTFWTLTPSCSNIVIVALYAVTVSHALVNARNAADDRAGVPGAAIPPLGVTRLAHTAARTRSLFI
jgi:hypothetical protein